MERAEQTGSLPSASHGRTDHRAFAPLGGSAPHGCVEVPRGMAGYDGVLPHAQDLAHANWMTQPMPSGGAADFDFTRDEWWVLCHAKPNPDGILQVPGQMLAPRRQLVCFDGRWPHAVLQFSGDGRHSVVFLRRRWGNCPKRSRPLGVKLRLVTDNDCMATSSSSQPLAAAHRHSQLG